MNEDRVEQRAKAVYELWRWLPGQSDWPSLSETGLRVSFLRIARAELEREKKLVEALRTIGGSGAVYWAARNTAQFAVEQYEAEFAPPQRTVEQIALELLSVVGETPEPRGYTRVPIRVLDELAAALKRKDA